MSSEVTESTSGPGPGPGPGPDPAADHDTAASAPGPAELAARIARRRTFAIISHPDAGKTTLTEKLLLYGGALRLAGTVKSRKSDRHATSDWMAMEQERGISVSTSVMQFEYADRHMNLLDTPGHNDFSEDTYRTLAAADCAIMLIDCVKGVEPQTIKLFEVCRMRQLPIVTLINKMDRVGREPLDLLAEIEQVLGIPATPANWPIGSGKSFQGVYDRWNKRLLRFERSGDGGARKVAMATTGLDDPSVKSAIGDIAYQQLREDIELLDVAGDDFDTEAFLAGLITPVFFGSALTNFGIEPFLDAFVDLAPAPRPRATTTEPIAPETPAFTGFVFKIQANMDPRHRDRVAFIRVCSGRFERGMQVKQVATGKTITLAKPLQFLAQERMLIDEAFAGDIIGMWDPGQLRIGDTLTQGIDVEFEGIPRFSPEHFVRVRLKDVLKRKQLKKGLDQLSEEGAVQVFYDRERMERDPILGAVGQLQFDVVKSRLENEYAVAVEFDRQPFQFARWIEGEGFDPAEFERRSGTTCLLDVEGRPIVLFSSEWVMRRLEEQYKDLKFVAAVKPGRIQKHAG